MWSLSRVSGGNHSLASSKAATTHEEEGGSVENATEEAPDLQGCQARNGVGVRKIDIFLLGFDA